MIYTKYLNIQYLSLQISTGDLHKIMTTALQDDKVNFVRLLLHNRVIMKEFLTHEKLVELYKSVNNKFLNLNVIRTKRRVFLNLSVIRTKRRVFLNLSVIRTKRRVFKHCCIFCFKTDIYFHL